MTDLLDEIGEWLCSTSKKRPPPFNRFVDFSRLASLAVRINHVFKFAKKRAEQFAVPTPVKSALFSESLGWFWRCPAL